MIRSRSKYGNHETIVDGIRFDSRHEAHRWIELRYMERVGLITELKRQVPFELIPNQKENGKVIERAWKYIADFTYKNADGELVVEDAKSEATRTREYIGKRKMMLWEFGIKIQEV